MADAAIYLHSMTMSALEELINSGELDAGGPISDDGLFDPISAALEVGADDDSFAITPVPVDLNGTPTMGNHRNAAKAAATGTTASGAAAADPDAAVNDLLTQLGEQTSPARQRNARRKKEAQIDRTPIPRPGGIDYIPRKLGELSDVATMRQCRADGIPVLLSGYPGCGKTALTEAAFGEELITLEGHGDTEVQDFVGTWVPQPDGSYQWVNGPLTTAMLEGRPLLIDDCTLIPPGVLARVYPVMDGRGKLTLREHEGEAIEAKDGFFVIGAHNPGAPGAVLAEALASRFPVHIEVESDLNLARKLGIDNRMIEAAANLRNQRREGVISWAPEMRELIAFQKVQKSLGANVAVGNMIAISPQECRETVMQVLRRSWKSASPLVLGDDDEFLDD